MKTPILALLVAHMVTMSVFGQQDERQFYEHKIQSYSHMRSAGWTMAGIGSGGVIIGSVLLSTLPDGYWDDDYYGDDVDDEVDHVFQAVSGVVVLAIGIGLSAGGITLASISSHKLSTYRSKLNNLSLGVICTPSRQGLTLTYRF
jgi:hypothetical protein